MRKQRFPQISEACHEAVQEHLLNIVNSSDPFIAKISKYVIYEGNYTHIVQIASPELGQSNPDDATNRVTTPSILKELSGSATMTLEALRNTDIDGYKEGVQEMGTQIAERQGQVIFSGLHQNLISPERSFDAQGEPFSIEVFLKLLEKLELHFDEKGQWIASDLSIVTSPEMKKVIEKVLAEAEADPDKRQRIDQLLLRKREEFYAKEANRKLVD